tara:strand:+ start:1454 stop:1597 length:144 start_codon:yes stop_codon:yes gene_type:complete
MKYKVQMFTSGQVWWFECFAKSLSEAKQVAKNQYPNARIMSATGTFL